MKRALVTGGSSAIGAAVSKVLAADDIEVVVQANANLAAAQETVDAINAAGGTAEALELDLLDDNAVGHLTTLAEERAFQILVHCAGGQRDMPFAAMSFQDWQHVIDINLNSFYYALRPLILPMMRGRWGRIVALSSLTAIVGNRGQTSYAAAKGGMLPMVKSLTREYGSRGITANVVAPGLIDTEETRKLENFSELARFSPTGRAGTPEEVAALVRFLVSEEAGYISGQIIALDGGTT